MQFGSFERKQVQIDSTGKLTKDGEWLYRFVGVFRDSNYQTDYVKDDRIVLAPSLTWRPTKNTTWTVLGTYQKDKTGSSTAFLPHEGSLFPAPTDLFRSGDSPVIRAGTNIRPSPARSPACSSTASAKI